MWRVVAGGTLFGILTHQLMLSYEIISRPQLDQQKVENSHEIQ